LLAFSLSDTYGIKRFVSTCFPHQSILIHPHQKCTSTLIHHPPAGAPTLGPLYRAHPGEGRLSISFWNSMVQT